MRHALTGALAIAAVLALLAVPAAAQDAALDELLSKALALHQSGDLEGAAALYVQVLRATPDAALVRSNLGAAYAALGRYPEAIAEYRRALEGHDDPMVRQNLVLSQFKAGLLAEAATDAERVLSAQPKNRSMLLVLADCRLRLGQDAEVVKLLTPVAQANPDDKSVAYTLGTALLDLGRTDEAQLLMDRVFRDNSPEAHILLGAMYARHGEQASALEEYRQALEQNPKLPLANFLSGQCLMQVSDWAGAAAAFRRELEIDKDHFEANLMLGDLLRKEGRHEEALVYLTHAGRLRPGDIAVEFALGATYAAMGRLAEGVPLLEAVRAARPEHLPTHLQLAAAYARLGRKQDASREREVAVRLQKEADARSFEGARDRLDDLLGKPRPASGTVPQAPPE